jgi:hypothetical protein
VVRGFNACCFAYGQTGSGKTYTIFGERADERGIVPRAVEHLLAEVAKRQRLMGGTIRSSVYVSMVENYLDQLYDLGRAVQLARDVKPGGSGGGGGGDDDAAADGGGAAGRPAGVEYAPVHGRARPVLSTRELAAQAAAHAELRRAVRTDIRESADGRVYVDNLEQTQVHTLEQVRRAACCA